MLLSVVGTHALTNPIFINEENAAARFKINTVFHLPLEPNVNKLLITTLAMIKNSKSFNPVLLALKQIQMQATVPQIKLASQLAALVSKSISHPKLL